MAYPNEALGKIISRPAPEASCGTAPMRAFPDLARRVSIAQQAAEISAGQLNDVHNRLGLQREHGPLCDECEPGATGEVEALGRAIDRLTDTVRDIRGFAETLNARL